MKKRFHALQLNRETLRNLVGEPIILKVVGANVPNTQVVTCTDETCRSHPPVCTVNKTACNFG